jgi:hypothetical protein
MLGSSIEVVNTSRAAGAGSKLFVAGRKRGLRAGFQEAMSSVAITKSERSRFFRSPAMTGQTLLSGSGLSATFTSWVLLRGL